MTDHNTQELVAKLRIASREVHTVPNSAARLYGDAADLIEAQAAEIGRLAVLASRSELSAVAKALAWEGPYQCSLAKRVESLINTKDLLSTCNAEMKGRIDILDRAIDAISEFPEAAVFAIARLLVGDDVASYAAAVTSLAAARKNLATMTTERDAAYQRGYDARQAEIIRALEEAGGRIVLTHGPAGVGMVPLTNERAELLDRVIGALAEELGVDPDNELMHKAIHEIKEARDAALAQAAEIDRLKDEHAAMRSALAAVIEVADGECPENAAVPFLCGAHIDVAGLRQKIDRLLDVNDELRKQIEMYGTADHGWYAAYRREVESARMIQAQRWPSGCHKPSSCARNRACMYTNCRHQDEDIGACIDEAAREAENARMIAIMEAGK